jgi:sortase (surface protein transpeptidase)
VDTDLMKLGLRANGSLEVPPRGFPAGWYTGMSSPGELGPAIIAGHVDMNGPGVFYRLHNLKPGDLITVTRADGSKPVFRVTKVAQFPKDKFPTQLVYGHVNRSVLRLVTCGGSFNSRTGHYEDNIIAFADLLAP